MSNLLREQQGYIENQINSTLTLNARFSDYLAGGPTFLIYYQINSQAYKEDAGLEAVHSLVGANAPIKYNKIQSFMCYGVDTLSVTNALNERGANSTISGDFIIPPNSIVPYPDEFFSFDIPGIRDNIFKIKDVQQDKISPEKYFRVSFELWQSNTNMIFDNIIKTYTMVDGKNSTVIMEDSEVVAGEKVQFGMDEVINRYVATFYDELNNCFSFRNDSDEFYWSPYLEQFIHNTNCLDYNKVTRYLNEIYIMGVSEREFPNIFNQTRYYDSIFHSIEKGINNITFDMGFMCVEDADLKSNRNLPFFMSNETFKIIAPLVKSYKDGIPNGDVFTITSSTYTTEKFSTVDHYHKVHEVDDAHIKRLMPYLKDGELLYHCPENEIWATAVYKIKLIDGELYLIDMSLDAFFKNSDLPDPGQEIFYFLKQYLNGTLIMDKRLQDFLYTLKVTPTMMNYIFLPMLLHACKEQLLLNIKRKA